MTRVFVSGGRDYQDRGRVFQEIDRLDDALGVSLVIHGACMKKGSIELQGADRWAQEWALEHERPYIGFPAQWTKHGRPAGPRRNGEMIRRMKPEFGIVFPGGIGTADMTKQARASGIEVWEIQSNRPLDQSP